MGNRERGRLPFFNLHNMFKRIVFSVAILAICNMLMSWGVVGHRVVGQLAENHLSKKARKAVKELLGTESLAIVSTYPDEIRSYEIFAYTVPWHYVNVLPGLDQVGFEGQLMNMKNPNIYKAIEQCIADLENPDKSKEDKIFALKFLVHLVGDIHQPMHLGRSEDAGGNRIEVLFGRREINLHSLWDTRLVEQMGMTFTELARACEDVPKREWKQWQGDSITTWAFESYTLAAQLYEEAADNPNFDYSYFPTHADVVKQRLARAGWRLAGILNEIYR